MTNLTTVEVEDEAFIQQESLQCTLFLQTTETNTRFLILDQQQKIRLLQETKTDNLLKKKSIYLNLRYNKVYLLTPPETFIFVPEEFKDIDSQFNIDQYLLSPIEDKILEKEIGDSKITTRFTVNKMTRELQDILDTELIIPTSNILIQETLAMQPSTPGIIGINVYEKEVEMAYVIDGRFIFYNRFPKTTADEFNYFLLAVFEQFAVQPATTTFYLSGEISDGDENHKRVEKYSANVYFFADKKSVPEQLDKTRSHRYHQLLELSKCG